MRTIPLASLSLLLVVIAASLVLRVSEQVAVAMVVASLVLCVVMGLLLFTGVRAAQLNR